MLKMFTTQLMGLFKALQEKEEFSIEDSARLLVQASAGQGTVYLYGTAEMKGVVYEATKGAEPLTNASKWDESMDLDTLHDTDRFLILSRYSNDDKALHLAKELANRGIPFVAISTTLNSTEKDSIEKLADVHIGLKLTKGLLPDEQGGRFGYPALMAALFVYYGLRFTMDEILSEYNE